MARYLLAVSPLRGHVLPMVTVGQGLQALGHDITVLTGSEFTDTVTGAGLRMAPLPDSIRIDPPDSVSALLRRLPTQLRRFCLGRVELDSIFVEPLAVEANTLADSLRDEPVDAIVADVTFTGVVPLLLADAPRPPVVVCGVGPLTLSSANTPAFGMAWQPRAGADYRPMTAVAHRVIMRASQRRFNRALRQADCRRSPVFICDWPRLADGLLQLSVQEFEYPRSDLPAMVEFVGPTLPVAAGGFHPPHWWADVLEATTVVHVTQGTFDNADLDQLIGPTLDALGDRDDLLVVATTGGRPGQRWHGQVPANARIADWIPYPALMPHVDVMITNGGYGGVQHALSHGVPLIVAGETSDKAEVAARVDYSGVGIDLATAAPSAAVIRAAVDRIRSDGGYRAAAHRMRTAIASSTPIDAIANALKRCCDA